MSDSHLPIPSPADILSEAAKLRPALANKNQIFSAHLENQRRFAEKPRDGREESTIEDTIETDDTIHPDGGGPEALIL